MVKNSFFFPRKPVPGRSRVHSLPTEKKMSYPGDVMTFSLKEHMVLVSGKLWDIPLYLLFIHRCYPLLFFRPRVLIFSKFLESPKISRGRQSLQHQPKQTPGKKNHKLTAGRQSWSWWGNTSVYACMHMCVSVCVWGCLGVCAKAGFHGE